MYIDEITIDGFKSYASRVTLPNFDPCFNAITGLNGTGKSNILDSICFVMGLKTLAQIRAASLQELVYKQGQAGINKATVSITFRNDDPAKSPQGYEDKERITITRQIVIGGRNKYMINGAAAMENRVTDFFQGVQLNINNPHFLIMQGRITKVLNMKPLEILGLLEEASGTKMYERKKDMAEKTLEKKQAKLLEIDSVLIQDILPVLETLRCRVRDFEEWAALGSAKERVGRVLVALDYTTCQRNSELCGQGIRDLEAGVAARAVTRAQKAEDLQERTSALRDLHTEKGIRAGGQFKELALQSDALQLQLTKLRATVKHKSASVATEKAASQALANSLAELAGVNHEAAVATAAVARDGAKLGLEAAEKAVEAATRELAGVEAGDGRDESNRSLTERLADAQKEQTAADGSAKQADMAAKHLVKLLAERRKELATKSRESGTLDTELAASTASLAERQRRLQGLSFDAAEMSRLEGIRQSAGVEVRKAKEEVERLSHDVGNCSFPYSDPHPGFDRSKVHGVVARLVRVLDPAAATALEVTAGGKLYQVVVDSEVTASALLQKGKLTKRVTIIPLNKIQAWGPSQNAVAAALRLGVGKAQPALQLVGCDEEVKKAIEYAFGTTFVCKDSSTAQKLAFSQEVNCRCVSLEGDDFNPSGLLTGGHRNTSGSVLTKLHALGDAERALQQHKEQLAMAETGLKAMGAAAKEYRKLQQEVELQVHSLGLLQERIGASEPAQLAAAVAALEAELAAAQLSATTSAASKKELVATAQSLEREIRDFDKERGSRTQAANAKLKKSKADVEVRRKALKVTEVALVAALAELEAAGGETEGLKVQATAAAASVAALEAEVAAIQVSLTEAQQQHASTDKQLAGLRARLQECDSEIGAMEKARDAATRDVEAVEAEAKKAERVIKEKQVQLKSFADYVHECEKAHAFVLLERHTFGTGDYAFTRERGVMVAELEDATAQLDGHKGEKQARAGGLLQSAEAEFNSLKAKRSIVEQDKEKIMKVIGELDEKKRWALEDTWTKVNAWFGSIFSSLLPGTQAKLEPPEGATWESGLEVRVGFGSVWKESLTELSGGQRSLLALSLILALCRFKPAPLYILDEVDAALDLNHTQNIGRMIKDHFPGSQFIIVSLKEGMFNNANVIFRTKFVDGVSNVMRTVNNPSRRVTENRGKGAAAATAAGGRRGVLQDSNRG
ncbi:MAG: hypothetical protein WDW36_000815 [Sanguina aurantia]